MSLGSKLYVEILMEGQWRPFPKVQFRKGVEIPVPYMSNTSQYELYAAFIGYEHFTTYNIFYSEPIFPVSLPCEFPEDINPVFKNHFTQGWIEVSGWSTWFMLQDLIIYDWDRKFPEFLGYVDNQYASLFDISAAFPESFPEDAIVYTSKEPDTVEVSWIESYRDFVGSFYFGNYSSENKVDKSMRGNIDDFIGELLKLGDPKSVRILFGLTY